MVITHHPLTNKGEKRVNTNTISAASAFWEGDYQGEKAIYLRYGSYEAVMFPEYISEGTQGTGLRQPSACFSGAIMCRTKQVADIGNGFVMDDFIMEKEIIVS